MKVTVPFPIGPENLQEFLIWCNTHLGKMGSDWDLRPYDNEQIEIEFKKNDPSLIMQLQLIWG